MTPGARIALAILLAGAAIAGALLVNFLLLDLSTDANDPVGRLRPVIATTTSSTSGEPGQTTPERPRETESDDSPTTESDDDQDD